MAICGLDSYTLKELRHKIDSFERDYKETIEFVGGMLYAEQSVLGKDLYLKYHLDVLNAAHHKGDVQKHAYLEIQNQYLRTYLIPARKALELAEELKFSTSSDKGYKFVINFKDGTCKKVASSSSSPYVEFVGFSCDIDHFRIKTYKRKTHLDLGVENISAGYLELGKIHTHLYSNEKRGKSPAKDFKGRELIRRLLSMIMLALPIGLMITYASQPSVKENSTFIAVLYLYCVFGTVNNLFSVKRRMIKNIVPTAIWLAIGIVLPTLVITLPGILSALLLAATIIIIAIKDFLYNGVYKEISIAVKANTLSVRILRVSDIVEVVIAIILGLFATGIIEPGVLKTLYLPFLPIMSILLLLVILGSLINILKGQYKTVEEALPQQEAASKHKAASGVVDKVVKSYCSQFDNNTYKLPLSKGQLLVKILHTYESGRVKFTFECTKQINSLLTDWGEYLLSQEINSQLGKFAERVGDGLISEINKKEETKDYAGSLSISVELGKIQ